MEQSLLWLIWRGVEVRAREKWLVDEATNKANAAYMELMMEEENEVRGALLASPFVHRGLSNLTVRCCLRLCACRP